MVTLIAMIKRRPGTSPEDFHRHWRDHHGPLVASTRSGSWVLRYEQHHRPLSDYRSADDDGWDGVTVQWFESREAFFSSLREDDYRVIDDDMRTFIDTASIQWVLTDEPDVIVDRVGSR